MAKQHDEVQFDYAAKTAELDAVLVALQNPEIGLDEALQLHTKGTALVQLLEKYLAEAEVIIREKTTIA